MTDEQIKNIVNKLLNKFITKGTLPGEHRQMILLEEEVDELEFDLTQSIQKYGEKVRGEERERIKKIVGEDDWVDPDVKGTKVEDYGVTHPFNMIRPVNRNELRKEILTSLTKQEKRQR